MKAITAYDDIRRRLKNVTPSMFNAGQDLVLWQKQAGEKFWQLRWKRVSHWLRLYASIYKEENT